MKSSGHCFPTGAAVRREMLVCLRHTSSVATRVNNSTHIHLHTEEHDKRIYLVLHYYYIFFFFYRLYYSTFFPCVLCHVVYNGHG